MEVQRGLKDILRLEAKCEDLRHANELLLAERAELLEAIQEARAFIYEHLGSGWAVGDMLEVLSRKANGATP